MKKTTCLVCMAAMGIAGGMALSAAGVTYNASTGYVTLSNAGSTTFNREHAVIRFADSGRIELPQGVTQVFAQGGTGIKCSHPERPTRRRICLAAYPAPARFGLRAAAR